MPIILDTTKIEANVASEPKILEDAAVVGTFDEGGVLTLVPSTWTKNPALSSQTDVVALGGVVITMPHTVVAGDAGKAVTVTSNATNARGVGVERVIVAGAIVGNPPVFIVQPAIIPAIQTVGTPVKFRPGTTNLDSIETVTQTITTAVFNGSDITGAIVAGEWTPSVPGILTMTMTATGASGATVSRIAFAQVYAATAPANSFITDTAVAARRAMLVDQHDLGGSSEFGFAGFTDFTGWTTIICNTPDEVRTAVSNMTPTSKLRILCAWNGVLTFTGGTYMVVTAASELTPDATVDWGYVRPDCFLRIDNQTGFTPSFGVSTDALSFSLVGAHWTEFTGLTFEGAVGVRDNPAGGAAGPPILVMRGCTVKGLINCSAVRLLHMEENNIQGSGRKIGTVNCERWFNNNFYGGDGDFDCIKSTGYSGGGYINSWNVNIWLAGNVIHNTVHNAFGNGNHMDILQIGAAGETHKGYNVLGEFNYFMSDYYASQVFLASDCTSGSNHILFQNDLVSTGAYWAVLGRDPEGLGSVIVYRYLALRNATPFHYPAADQNSHTMINIRVSPAELAVGGMRGYYRTSETYVTVITDETGAMTTDGNIVLDPKDNAGGANAMDTLLTGYPGQTRKGFFLDAARNNELAYTDPTTGLSAAASKVAQAGFAMPDGGWRVAGAGPVAPSTWPTTGTVTLV